MNAKEKFLFPAEPRMLSAFCTIYAGGLMLGLHLCDADALSKNYWLAHNWSDTSLIVVCRTPVSPKVPWVRCSDPSRGQLWVKYSAQLSLQTCPDGTSRLRPRPVSSSGGRPKGVRTARFCDHWRLATTSEYKRQRHLIFSWDATGLSRVAV